MRKLFQVGLLLVALLAAYAPVAAQPVDDTAGSYDPSVATAWFDLILELIRQTPGFTPPVASRAMGYAGVSLYEAVAPGIPGAVSLAGQLNGLKAVPQPAVGEHYHWPLVANSALAGITRRLFAGGSPQQVAMNGLEASIRKRYAGTVPAAVAKRSIEHGRLVAAAIFAWSKTDGGHEGYLFNFPTTYAAPTGEGAWVPTAPDYRRAMQPHWGQNRPFVLSSGDECAPPPPVPYSDDPTSPMYQEAMEVYTTVRDLTPEQREIALYWADDPNLTATPPGHSLAIATQLLRQEQASLALAAELYGRLGIALADSFIACWNVKYTYNRIRPITYIQQNIDPAWNAASITDPVLTPPFPEYPSGHSTESGAAANVLAAIFGANYAFVDQSHVRLGFPPRAYASFDAAAEEAAVSRLYGGIHFRSANENGLQQGRCIGQRVLSLQMAGFAQQPN